MPVLPEVFRDHRSIFRLELGRALLVHRRSEGNVQLIPRLGQDEATKVGQRLVEKHEGAGIHALGQSHVDRLAIPKGTAQIELKVPMPGQEGIPYDAPDAIASQQNVVGNSHVVGSRSIIGTAGITFHRLPDHHGLVIAVDIQCAAVIMRHKHVVIAVLINQISRQCGAYEISVDSEGAVVGQNVLGVELKFQRFGQPEHGLGNVNAQPVDVVVVQPRDVPDGREAVGGQADHPRPGPVEAVGVELAVVGPGIDERYAVAGGIGSGGGAGGVATQEEDGGQKSRRTGAADDDVVGGGCGTGTGGCCWTAHVVLGFSFGEC
mmetsp:Transcript_12279/g.35145  ORF Transcript_12279/g.35145 Transcript_12279/m.35145 type:complete len:320 (+) Transcript_12279:725-1684(+)